MTMDEHTKSLLQALIDDKQLERIYSDGDWAPVSTPLLALYNVPHKNLRVKQPTIRIGELDVPEPLRVAPTKNTEYWIAKAANASLTYQSEWVNDNSDILWLNRGLVHLSEEAAVAHAKALIAVSGGTV